MKISKLSALLPAAVIALSICALPVGAEDAPAETAAAETAETAEAPAEPAKNGIVEENGSTYYYADGEMKTGWVTVAGERYYFRKNGEKAVNIKLLLDDKYYVFGADGKVIYSDPEPETGETSFRPPIFGESAESIYGRCGITCWQAAQPRNGSYAYNARTFINGKKCVMTLEFDSRAKLMAWYIDIPADDAEKKLLLNWLIALWGENYEQDENGVFYWYYSTDDENRGMAASFEDEIVSVSAIRF